MSPTPQQIKQAERSLEVAEKNAQHAGDLLNKFLNTSSEKSYRARYESAEKHVTFLRSVLEKLFK